MNNANYNNKKGKKTTIFPLKELTKGEEVVPEQDFVQLAGQIVDRSHIDDEKIVKSRIVPLISAPYDDLTKEELKELLKGLKDGGYPNALIMEDLKTKTCFEGKWDMKYIRLLNLSVEEEYFIVPLFYFPPPDRSLRLGHHSELIDLIMMFDNLIHRTGIFRFDKSPMLNQARIIPIHHHFWVKNIQEIKDGMLNFVDAYFPYFERKLLSKSLKHLIPKKSFYTPKFQNTKRDVVK